MPLTPEQIKEARQKYGIPDTTTSSTTKTPNQRNAEIDSWLGVDSSTSSPSTPLTNETPDQAKQRALAEHQQMLIQAHTDAQAKADRAKAEADAHQEKHGFLRNTWDFFTGAEQKFGETLGTAASTVDSKLANILPGVKGETATKMRQDTLDSAAKQSDNYLQMAIKETDPTRKKNYLQAAQEAAKTEGIDIYNNPEYQKTAKQIAGEAGGVALDVLSAGTYGEAANGMKAGKLAAKAVPKAAEGVGKAVVEKTLGQAAWQGTKAGTKAGAVYGAGKGLTGAMADNQDVAGIAASTVLGSAGGAILGGATGALFATAGSLFTKMGKSARARGKELTPDEFNTIISTPENKVKTLTPDQQSVYFKHQKDIEALKLNIQKEKINAEVTSHNSQAEIASSGVSSDMASAKAQKLAAVEKFKASTNKLSPEAQQLSQQVQDIENNATQKSVNKVVELRPKAAKVFSQKGAEYGKLAEEALSPVTNNKVSNRAVSEHIDQAYVDDPQMGAAIKQKFGITEKNLDKSSTVGEIWGKIKDVKGGITKSAKSGTATYTAEDNIRKEGANSLTTFLQDKHGLDMSKPNKFWSEWKPVQQNINKTLGVYERGGVKTSKGSNLILNVASGNKSGIQNKALADQISKHLGEDITAETKQILAQKTQLEQHQIASRIQAEVAKSDALAKFEVQKAEAAAKKAMIENTRIQKVAESEAQKIAAKKAYQEAIKVLEQKKVAASEQGAKLARHKKIVNRILYGSGIGLVMAAGGDKTKALIGKAVSLFR